jgi:hypothetical protein
MAGELVEVYDEISTVLDITSTSPDIVGLIGISSILLVSLSRVESHYLIPPSTPLILTLE